MKTLIVCVTSLYSGAGLSMGLVMAQVLPLTPFGVSAYAVTWPYHVYCSRPSANCFGQMHKIVPDWIGHMMFNLERVNAKENTQ